MLSPVPNEQLDAAVGELRALASANTAAALALVLELFDRLPAVAEDALLGEWSGTVIPTGHPGEQQLGALRWAGKTFRSRNDVDPIVSHNDTGAREANPVLGTASIRMVEYRGVVTATMVYDRHPIFDHFHGVDGVLLGIMDRKGEPAPLAFLLERA